MDEGPNEMAIPAEVAFDRYLRNHTPYLGKQDLDRLAQQELGSLLAVIQRVLNEALFNEKRDVPEHVDHPPFHLDYIDAAGSNAHAFNTEEYSFIGLTIRLIYDFGDLCVRLSNSGQISNTLGIESTADLRNGLQAVLFQNLLSFVVSHEFTHIVHGHVDRRGAASVSFNEVHDDGEVGNLEEQTMEADADGYAAYHLLANMIDGGARSQAVTALKIRDRTAEAQDEILFSCFVVAVGAFLFARRPVDVDQANV
jgi:hypothetical protein